MNINEIARLSGVSRATVSRYLNNGYVSEEKKAVIRQVIEETGYQPSSQAQTLRTKKTKLVGVILPKINSDTISREVEGISSVLTAQGYQMILANTSNSLEEELKYLSLFKDNQVDGVIFLATMFTKKHKQMLKEYKVPIVILGQRLSGYPCIYQDDFQAAQMMMETLLETGRKAAYIGITCKDEAVGIQRKKGVEAAFAERRISLPKGCVEEGDFSIQAGYDAAKRLFERTPDIDTLMCATDTMAVGAMAYIKEIGLEIPRDVQVAGMGDGNLGSIVEPKLSTIRFSYRISGIEAAKLLAELIAYPEGVHKEIKMGCELVLRGSHREKGAE
ncbi:MAG: LacI family DNA-binding transcriptional regulator [Eubacteriales bacterium]|nr:LacI family DNA-binding transcriptional regulator [Eubacteriales bacterium]